MTEERNCGVKNMCKVAILLNSVDKVKKFVSTIVKFDAEMDLISGRCVIDAKSIMGILGMELSKPIMLRIHDEGKEVEEIVKAVKEYIVP